MMSNSRRVRRLKSQLGRALDLKIFEHWQARKNLGGHGIDTPDDDKEYFCVCALRGTGDVEAFALSFELAKELVKDSGDYSAMYLDMAPHNNKPWRMRFVEKPESVLDE